MTDLERRIKAKIPGEDTGIEVKRSLCAICSPGHHCGVDCYVKDGKIIRVEKRELRSGSKMMIFDLTDFTDSITIKMFLREDQEADADEAIKQGKFIKLKGITTIDRFDGELTVGSITGIKKCEDFTTRRVDNAPVKRVELHCHTKMSDMDGVSEVKDIIKRAK